MTAAMANVYKSNSINTASPAELTLMLYDGAIKFCNIALGAIGNGDVQKANTNIIKAPVRTVMAGMVARQAEV